MRILVVIVNYRTARLTIDCLRSLAPQVDPAEMRVVVTDCASGDDSPGVISDAIAANGWSAWTTLMPLERNGGFAYGNNAAIVPAMQSASRPEYVLLLNPDTIARPGAIQALVDFLDAHPQAGIVGSRLEDPDGTPQQSAFRFPSIQSEFEGGIRLGVVSRLLRRYIVARPAADQPHLTDWLAGASMMIRAQVFDAIGYLDERFFMYFEEVDFCRRARRAGWPCWYVPASRVVHLVGQSSGVTDVKLRKRRPPYWFASRKRYFVKNHGRGYACLADAAWSIGFALWRARRFVQRREDPDPPSLLSDFLRHSVFLKGFGT